MSARSQRRAAEREALKATNQQAPTQHVSDAQLAANRANAQFSHGPTSPEGIAISSRNHTIHGLTAEPAENFKVLPDENQAAYDALLTGFQDDWKPAAATEHDLVTRMATHAWLRNRAVRLQNLVLIKCDGYNFGNEDRKNFDLFARYYSAHGRAFSKALSEMMRLRNFQSRQEKDAAILDRRALDIQNRFESQKRAAEAHAAKMETVRLKQEAIKQRNQRAPKPEPAAQTSEISLTQTS
jgi:hypothetical protein